MEVSSAEAMGFLAERLLVATFACAKRWCGTSLDTAIMSPKATDGHNQNCTPDVVSLLTQQLWRIRLLAAPIPQHRVLDTGTRIEAAKPAVIHAILLFHNGVCCQDLMYSSSLQRGGLQLSRSSTSEFDKKPLRSSGMDVEEPSCK